MTDDSSELTHGQRIFVNNLDILMTQCYSNLLLEIKSITLDEDPRKLFEKYARLVGLLHAAKLEMMERIV